MITCIQCLAQLDALFDGGLDPVQMLRIDKHTGACPTCGPARRQKFNEKLELRGIFNVYVKDTPARNCLSPQTLEEYRAGGLAEDESVIAELHVAQCTSCNEKPSGSNATATGRERHWLGKVAAAAEEWLQRAAAVALRGCATEFPEPARALDDDDRPREATKVIALSEWLTTDNPDARSPWMSAICRLTEFEERGALMDRFFVVDIQGDVSETAGALRVGLTAAEGGMLEAVLRPQSRVAILEGEDLPRSARLDDLNLWIAVEGP